MIAGWAVWVLIKTAPLTWASAAAALGWILDDGPPEMGAAMAYCLVLALAGTICREVRRRAGSGADELLAALLATPPAAATAPVLRLAVPEATRSSIPAAPASAG